MFITMSKSFVLYFLKITYTLTNHDYDKNEYFFIIFNFSLNILVILNSILFKQSCFSPLYVN